MTQIQKILFKYQDKDYADFTAKLIPNIPRESFIGVRVPNFKPILKELSLLPPEETAAFMKSLPHQYHEENALHISLINQIKDCDQCISEIEHFLPYISNWAISDSLSPKTLEKNKDRLEPKMLQWIQDPAPYTKRVGMLLLKKYFLDSSFKVEYLEQCAQIRSEEYYVNMMTAWLFAEALVKQWDSTILFLTQKRLAPWTHNKAIQKAVESFRITPEQKTYLKTLKVKVQKSK